MTRGVAYYNYSGSQASHRATSNFKGNRELNSIICPKTRRSKKFKTPNSRLITRINKELSEKNDKKIKIPKRVISKRN